MDEPYSLDPDLSDIEDDADESDTDDSTQAGDAEVVDAAFDCGVDVPAAAHVTRYPHLIKHFKQKTILHESFVAVFRNCSLSSHS
jgi:hypothetical protein